MLNLELTFLLTAGSRLTYHTFRGPAFVYLFKTLYIAQFRIFGKKFFIFIRTGWDLNPIGKYAVRQKTA